MGVKEKMQVYDSILSFMADSNENDSRSTTLLDIKENLMVYSLNKLRVFASTLINFLNKITQDKINLKEALKKCELEVIELIFQMTELISEKEN